VGRDGPRDKRQRRAGRWKRVRGGVFGEFEGTRKRRTSRSERARAKWEVPRLRVKREAKGGGERGDGRYK